MTTLCQSDVNFFYYIHTTDAKTLIHRYTLGLVVYIHSSITYYIHAIAIAIAIAIAEAEMHSVSFD